MNNVEKMKIAKHMEDALKDYKSLLSIASKMKLAHNVKSINEQIELNESDIKENANKLL